MGAEGETSAELLVVLRRVMRMARDWHVPIWVVKLDIRKAFGSVWDLVGEAFESARGKGPLIGPLTFQLVCALAPIKARSKMHTSLVRS